MSRPLAVKRLKDIRRLLRIEGVVRVAELAERFDVSQETVRRDLKSLAQEQFATIVHGGATLFSGTVEPNLEARSGHRAELKDGIAQAAAALVASGATILLDSGSTTLHLAKALAEKASVTTVTNSLGAATLLARAGRHVHMLPGEVNSNDEAVLSTDTIEALAHYRFDAAFIAAGGLSVTSGLTDYSRIAAQFRSKLLLSTERPYVLLDSTKFGRETPFPVANLDRAAAIISDARPKASLARWLAKRKIRLIVPKM
jgi:DeoR/GlpR family transcriptional regulator of sugar metabolism